MHILKNGTIIQSHLSPTKFKVISNERIDNKISYTVTALSKPFKTLRFSHDYVKHTFTIISEPSEQSKTPSNLITDQTHYTSSSIQPIDLMKANFTKEEYNAFLLGNILKYTLRYKKKNGVEDLKKAQTYLSWLIESEETK